MLGRDFVGTMLGRYRIVGVLGQGGMGVVLDAVDETTGLPVALKVLSAAPNQSKSALKRFRREARTAATLGRPHVTEIYEVGVLDTGEPYIAMEKLLGETLRQRLDRAFRLPPHEIVSTFSQLLVALEAVHAQGLVHRDIKPDNIFYARAGNGPPVIKIIDFGVVKLERPASHFQREEDTGQITSTGIVVGTPAYVSPEQILSPDKVDARADLWAVGVCMYEAMTGRLPFSGSAAPMLMVDILNRPPAPPRALRSDCPTELEQIILRALEKVPGQRFENAAAFRRELLSFWSARRDVHVRDLQERDNEDSSAEIVVPMVDLAKLGALDLPRAQAPPTRTPTADRLPPLPRATPRVTPPQPTPPQPTPRRAPRRPPHESSDE